MLRRAGLDKWFLAPDATNFRRPTAACEGRGRPPGANTAPGSVIDPAANHPAQSTGPSGKPEPGQDASRASQSAWSVPRQGQDHSVVECGKKFHCRAGSGGPITQAPGAEAAQAVGGSEIHGSPPAGATGGWVDRVPWRRPKAASSRSSPPHSTTLRVLRFRLVLGHATRLRQRVGRGRPAIPQSAPRRRPKGGRLIRGGPVPFAKIPFHAAWPGWLAS